MSREIYVYYPIEWEDEKYKYVTVTSYELNHLEMQQFTFSPGESYSSVEIREKFGNEGLTSEQKLELIHLAQNAVREEYIQTVSLKLRNAFCTEISYSHESSNLSLQQGIEKYRRMIKHEFKGWSHVYNLVTDDEILRHATKRLVPNLEAALTELSQWR